MKKKFKASMIVLLVITIMPSVLAETQGYVSSLKISSHSNLQGASRKYSYNNHKITINNPKLDEGDEFSKLVIAIYQDGLFSNKQYSRRVASIYNGESVTAVMGAAGSGKRFYCFGTYENALKDANTHGAYYSGVTSDNVSMISYN